MKKKLITILSIVLLLLLLSGCTMHFKADKMELETEPPEAKIGQNQNSNTTYYLAAVDVLKDVSR